ncbi:MAG: hypothetical protein ACKOAH_12585, partial [Pirellula sp.]
MSQIQVSMESAVSTSVQKRLGRIAGIAFGVGTQVLFLWTVIYLFLFLRFGGWREYSANDRSATWWIDASLATLFVVPHSILRAPMTSKWLKQWM